MLRMPPAVELAYLARQIRVEGTRNAASVPNLTLSIGLIMPNHYKNDMNFCKTPLEKLAQGTPL